MHATPRRNIESFVVIGTNFTKADTQTRSRFAITASLAEQVYQQAVKKGLTDFLILSTCNRTEFYALSEIATLKQLLAEQLQLCEADLNNYFYIRSGKQAIQQFFRVVSGLDSQIIGDYEIVCQVKAALETSRKYNLIGTITDRAANFAFQGSKKVKSHTNLSSGKYSVSYAVAELMFHEHTTQALQNILLVGASDFGATVGRNLRHYFPTINLSVTNRTREKAEKLAAELAGTVLPFETFREQLREFDVIITTIGLESYLIHSEHLLGVNTMLLLDLSVPQAVNPEVNLLPGVRHYSVDEISAFHNEILKQRKLEIPRAEIIVDLYVKRFVDWLQTYTHSHLILGYKKKIKTLVEDHATRLDNDADEHHTAIEKTFSGLMKQIKSQGYTGCMMIEAMNNLVPSEK